MKIGNSILRIASASAITFILVLFVIVYPIYKDAAIDEYVDNVKVELNHLNFFMEEFVTNTQNDLLVLSDNDIFQKYNRDFTSYLNVEVEGFEYLPSESELNVIEYFEDYIKVNESIEFIYFANKSGTMAATTTLYDSGLDPSTLNNYDPRQRPWYIEAVDHPDKAIVTPPYTGPSGYDFYITTSKAIKDADGKIIGVVGIDLNINKLSDYFKSVRKDQPGLLGLVQGNSMIQIENDLVVLSEVSMDLSRAINDLYESNKNYIEIDIEEASMLVAMSGNLPGWDYFLLIPEKIIFKQVNDSFLGIYSMVIIFFSLGILALLYSLRKIIINPIISLGHNASYIANTGNLEYKIEPFKTQELKVLAESFNRMIERIKENRDSLEGQVEIRTKELQKQQAFLENFINNSTSIIYVKDRDLRYLLVNQSWRDLFGIQSDVDVVGKTTLEVFGNDGYTNPSDDLEIFKSGLPTSLDDELILNGEKRCFIQVKFPLIEEDGEVSSVCSIGTETTAYKKSEFDLDRKRKQQKVLFDTMPIGVSMISPTGQILEANRVAEDILGMSADEQKKTEISSKEYKIIQSNGEVMAIEDYPASRVLSGEPVVSNVEMGVVTGDSVIWISTTAAAIDEHSGGGVVVLFEDITLKREAEQALINAKLAAEEALRVKSDFLANMSHEIRTPMNAVIGLGALLEKTGLDSKQHDYVEKINRASSSLLGIINDILDFSKIEAGKLLMEKVSFSLNEVMGNISSVIGIKALEKGIEFLIIKESNVPQTLLGDPLRLNQVLLNLVNNAVKFTEKGEVSIRVSVMDEEDGVVTLRFSVKDSGIGMTDDQVSKLFNAFSQADTSITRKYGGTGLGLTISKRIIEFMNGSIMVRSEDGVGSEFYFDIPFEYNEQTNHKSQIVPEVLKSLKIAVLEDNKVAREVYEHYLGAFIERVDLFSDIEIFKSAVKSESYDLALLDYKLVGTTGLEVWKDIRDSIDQKTKPVLITAHGKDHVVEAANQVGIEMVLMKPVTQSSLYDGLMLTLKEETIDLSESKVDDYVDKMVQYAGNRILLVEDNKINQQVALENLEEIGFAVEVANNGVEAIEMVVNSTEDYDLILMDLQMPIMDGFTATEQIRNIKTKEELPIIALSADVMKETIERIKGLGMQSHVAKPIDLNLLFTAMSKVLKPKVAKHKKKTHVISEVIETDFESLLPDLDVPSALKRLSGNHNLYNKLLNSFYEEYKGGLSDQIFIDDYEGIIRFFHTLKGLSGNIGATTIQRLSGTLELGLKEGSIKREALEQLPLVVGINTEINKVIDDIGALTLTVVDKNVDSAEEEIDVETYKVLIDRLIELLDDYDMEAETVFNQVAKHIARHVSEEVSIQIGKYIREYDFDEATEILNTIKQELN